VTHVECREEVGATRNRSRQDWKILWMGLSAKAVRKRRRRFGHNINGRSKDLPER